jgi:RimJ/RimL family protein N-acetyltransferase
VAPSAADPRQAPAPALPRLGIATGAALTLFLQEQQIRPLHARAASDNAASIRVLQKAGFRITGTEISYANARGAEIEETILRLD